MSNAIPLKANFTGQDPTSIGEFQAGDVVSVTHGGTGATTVTDAKRNLGLDNLTNDVQLKASQLETTISDNAGKVPSSAAIVDYAAEKSHNHSLANLSEKNHSSLNNAGLNTHQQIDSHIDSTENPHATTKSQVGLGNVSNDEQLKASQLEGTISGDEDKVPSSMAIVEFAAPLSQFKFIKSCFLLQNL
jgi:hypothetical protein